MVVLGHTGLSVESAWMAERFASNLESGLVNAAMILDNVDDNAGLICELCNVLSTSVPSHDGAAIFKGFDKCCSY